MVCIVWAASAIKFQENYPSPKEMSEHELDRIEEAFLAAVKRCEEIGCKYTKVLMDNPLLTHV